MPSTDALAALSPPSASEQRAPREPSDEEVDRALEVFWPQDRPKVREAMRSALKRRPSASEQSAYARDLEAENARLRDEVGKARLLLSAANQDMAGPVMAEANRNAAWHVLDAALSPPSASEQSEDDSSAICTDYSKSAFKAMFDATYPSASKQSEDAA